MEFEKELRKNGLKNTPHRIRIMEVLESHDVPVSAQDIYARLKEDKVRISLSTVYRTLDKLVELDFVRKLSFTGEDSALFESIRKGHRHYLVCLKCRKKTVIDKCPIKDYQETLERESDFSIEGHKLAIYGYCPECK